MIESWEDKFNTLLIEYSLLSSEHNQLKVAHDRLRSSSSELLSVNSQLRKVISDMKLQLEYKSKDPEIIPNKSQAELQISTPEIVAPLRPSHLDYLVDIPAKAITPWKTPQPIPDMSIESDTPSSSLFEAFFVIGITPVSLETTPQECILFEYPECNCISPAMKKVMPGLALPSTQSKQLTLTGSASDLNNLVFGQIPSKRNENCYIFTLRSETTAEETTSCLPNSGHEVVYFMCLLIDDISEHKGQEWITPKCYCIASYVPIYELFYEVLCSVLFLKRLHRMDLMQSMEGETSQSLSNIDISAEGIELLRKLSEFTNLEEIEEISVKTNSMDCLCYKLPKDLHSLDIPWLCIPLLSSVTFLDFCWLISAVAQEKSIIFVSMNLGLVTSCVLGLRALIRPFRWMNLTIPIIPDNLRELLEAPVPILAGISHIDAKLRHKFPNIIWVLLDENDLNHRIQCSTALVFEVSDIQACVVNELKEFFMFELGNAFERTLELQERALGISRVLSYYWENLLKKFNVHSDKKQKKNIQSLVNQYPKHEQRFIKSLISTQMFMNTLEI